MLFTEVHLPVDAISPPSPQLSPSMGKEKREWQNVEYVLVYFGKRVGEARKRYRSCVEKGISLGYQLET